MVTGAVCLGQTNPPTSPAAVTNAMRAATMNHYFPNVDFVCGVEIGTGGGQPLHADIAWPKKPSRTPMPAIIYWHGGGWYSGTYENGDPWLGPFAMDGYFAVTAQYRLSGVAKWPAQIEDCKLAVRWLRANAAKYNVDPNRIGVAGSSAGAHLAACVGTMGNETQFEGTGGYPGVSSKVQAVVTYSAVTDFRKGNFTDGSEYTRANAARCASLIETLIGKPFTAKPDRYRQASPMTYVRAGLPPFLVIHGDKDESVSFQQGVTFFEALKKAGVPAEFLAVKNAGHSLGDQLPNCPPPAPNSAQVRDVSKEFLKKHLQN